MSLGAVFAALAERGLPNDSVGLADFDALRDGGVAAAVAPASDEICGCDKNTAYGDPTGFRPLRPVGLAPDVFSSACPGPLLRLLSGWP